MTDSRLEAATRKLIIEVRRTVPAKLVQASIFGSVARGDARPDSDVDVLLIFHRLPLDREPQATIAEEVADRTAWLTSVPVTVWSVSLDDLVPGRRTPMLVDALCDAVTVWSAGYPIGAVPFLPEDALECAAALLRRVAEGSREFAMANARGDSLAAARRARDDVVRLCTASLLLQGCTRPRRGDAVLEFRERFATPRQVSRLFPVLDWAANSFGPDGKAEDSPVLPPAEGFWVVPPVIDYLRTLVSRERGELQRCIAKGRAPLLRPGGPLKA